MNSMFDLDFDKVGSMGWASFSFSMGLEIRLILKIIEKLTAYGNGIKELQTEIRPSNAIGRGLDPNLFNK